MNNQQILYHCAPTLANVKMGNLFSLPYHDLEILQADINSKNQLLNPKGVHVRLLRHTETTALIYIFRKNQLQMALQTPQIQRFLHDFDYHDFDLDSALSILEEHLDAADFPHEIGVFLGYPLADIRGFIANQGKNFKISGCWKVYTNPEHALRLFARYKKCVTIYLDRYAQGFDMNRLTVVG